jgi:hypothetical protein
VQHLPLSDAESDDAALPSRVLQLVHLYGVGREASVSSLQRGKRGGLRSVCSPCGHLIAMPSKETTKRKLREDDKISRLIKSYAVLAPLATVVTTNHQRENHGAAASCCNLPVRISATRTLAVVVPNAAAMMGKAGQSR